MSEPTRSVSTYIGRNGHTTARVTMSPTSNKVRAEVTAPPDQAIPVVFIPGIMGSPLLALKDEARKLLGNDNRWAWFPDDTTGWVAGLTNKKGYRHLSPAERKLLLDPDSTRPVSSPEDADREVVSEHITTLPLQEALNRGWGSVMISSYGGILNFLEAQLRFILTPKGELYPGVQGAVPHNPLAWGQLQGYQPLTKEMLQQAADFRYPVYAAGYNWLQTNAKAADYLAGKVEAILDRCRKELRVKCDHGVILVTHSMGGLVGRMCAKRYPGLIQGVVHGVQPAVGAGTAYRRVRAGWEDFFGSAGLGGTGKKIMPVFANAAGPLELLPNHRYGAGWLRVTCNGRVIAQLPEAGSGPIDPYQRIYLEPRAWWRLIDPSWIDPDSLIQRPATPAGKVKLQEAWENYRKRLLEAKRFHTELGSSYHPNTYSYYGADEGQMAFHRVTWNLQPQMIAAYRPGLSPTRGPAPSSAHAIGLRMWREDHEGTVYLINDAEGLDMIMQHGVGVTRSTKGNSYVGKLQDRDQVGDATVPAHSAEDSAKAAVFAARMTGFEHQGSYDNRMVQNVTLYSVLRIGATATRKTVSKGATATEIPA
ncbi:esterase/lipase family protein [Pseudomonas paraeruginosa]|uniref:esterase/lipase family protein n=1 Tax=Pseudomonas paraeruginosa TaxID=2994495 RepID=UPI0039FBF7C5